MKTLLLVALGGAIGSMARFIVGKISLVLWGPEFPWGTMIVNIAGCFVMGVLAGLLSHYTELSQDVRAFLLVGILGGFTTFSAFALDIVTLYERGAMTASLFYLLASVAVSILALTAGLFIVRSAVS
jgi:CrcB protein